MLARGTFISIVTPLHDYDSSLIQGSSTERQQGLFWGDSWWVDQIGEQSELVAMVNWLMLL